MSKRQRDIIEMIRQKISLSQQIVATKDNEFSYYAGADFLTSKKLAQIDFILKNKLIPDQLEPILKLYRSYLNQQRKAFFGATSSELTQLGFILGVKDNAIRVSATNK